MKHLAWPLAALVLVLGMGLSSPALHAADASDTQAEIDELKARLHALEQRLEENQPQPASPQSAAVQAQPSPSEHAPSGQLDANAPPQLPPPVPSNPNAFGLRSADGRYSLEVHALLQEDGRVFFDNHPHVGNDGFLLRRLEPSLEGEVTPLVHYVIMPEFGGSTVGTADVYLDLRLDPTTAVLRFGKFKQPVGLENLESSGAIAFVERGLPTDLVPNRDLGAMLQGRVFGSTLYYGLGVFNGAGDGVSSGANPPVDSEKDFAARLFYEPFRNGSGFFKGLGFGVAGTDGREHTSDSSVLGPLVTPGQNTFFSYAVATGNIATAYGAQQRWSPQAYFFHSNWGLLAEYVNSSQEVASVATSGGVVSSKARIDNQAYELTASYILTGEPASYQRFSSRRTDVSPRHPFQLGQPGWGAFELVARGGQLDVGHAAFPVFADPTKSARRATAFGVGLNWSPTGFTRFLLDYDQTAFNGGAAKGNRPDERALLGRAELLF